MLDMCCVINWHGKETLNIRSYKEIPTEIEGGKYLRGEKTCEKLDTDCRIILKWIL